MWMLLVFFACAWQMLLSGVGDCLQVEKEDSLKSRGCLIRASQNRD